MPPTFCSDARLLPWWGVAGRFSSASSTGGRLHGASRVRSCRRNWSNLVAFSRAWPCTAVYRLCCGRRRRSVINVEQTCSIHHTSSSLSSTLNTTSLELPVPLTSAALVGTTSTKQSSAVADKPRDAPYYCSLNFNVDNDDCDDSNWFFNVFSYCALLFVYLCFMAC